MTGHQATVQTYIQDGAIVIHAQGHDGSPQARITLDPQVALTLADLITIAAHTVR